MLIKIPDLEIYAKNCTPIYKQFITQFPLFSVYEFKSNLGEAILRKALLSNNILFIETNNVFYIEIEKYIFSIAISNYCLSKLNNEYNFMAKLYWLYDQKEILLGNFGATSLSNLIALLSTDKNKLITYVNDAILFHKTKWCN